MKSTLHGKAPIGFAQKLHDVGLSAVAAVYEDINEPRLKVNNESSQRI